MRGANFFFWVADFTAGQRMGDTCCRRESYRHTAQTANCQISKSLRLNGITIPTDITRRFDLNFRQTAANKTHQSRIVGASAADNQAIGRSRQKEANGISNRFRRTGRRRGGAVFKRQTLQVLKFFVKNIAVNGFGRIHGEIFVFH